MITIILIFKFKDNLTEKNVLNLITNITHQQEAN